MSELRAIFDRLEQRSIKWDSYFEVYERLLAPYRGRAMTLVEIGVFNGGSLFMWREYLGDKARIIGVDMNPSARKMEGNGFEIFIGDQGSSAFWQNFYCQVGSIDVLIDDGGHRNNQQIITVESALEHINDGGCILIEDTHASYLKRFGNPSRYSFINYAFNLVHRINSRSGALATVPGACDNGIWSISFYESIVIFEIGRKQSKKSENMESGHKTIGATDYRYYADESPLLHKLEDVAARFLPKFFQKLLRSIQKRRSWVLQLLGNWRMRKFF